MERRGQGTRENVSAQPSGTFSTIPVPWTGSLPITASGPVRSLDMALSATITHNQADGSVTVTQVTQTTTAQRSAEPSRAYDFDGNWQVRVDAPAPTASTSDGAPADGWSPVRQHGPVTAWFPQHLVDADADPAQELPAPAALDDLPLWGVDSVLNPGGCTRARRRTSAPTSTPRPPRSSPTSSPSRCCAAHCRCSATAGCTRRC